MLKVFNAYDDNYSSADKAFDSSVDISTNGLCVLSPTTAKLKVEDFGGDYYLDITIPTERADLNSLKARNIIVADTPEGLQPFRITDPVYGGKTCEIKAKHVFFDAEDYYIISRTPMHSSPNATIGSLLNYLKNKSDTVKHQGMAPNCPFKLASVTGDDNPETTVGEKWSESFRETTLYQALIDFQNTLRNYDARIRLVRDGYYVALTLAQRQTDLILNYGGGLTESKIEYDFSDAVTRIIPIGKDQIPLDEWYLDYDSSRVTLIPKFFKMKKVDFSQDYLTKGDKETDSSWKSRVKADLKTMAQFYVNAHATGFVNYSVSALPPDDTNFKLGDVVTINDSRLDLTLKNVPVVGYEYNLITKKYENVEFGSIKKKLSSLKRK